jgi:uncharacterized protein (TIGR02271 family)
VYSKTNDEKIGTVNDVLVDEDQGRFRYFIVDTGFWVFGKKVLVPVGVSQLDHGQNRVYVNLTKEQAENLPDFHSLERIDYDYEHQVGGVYGATPADTAAMGVVGAAPVLDYAVAPATPDYTAPLDFTTPSVPPMLDRPVAAPAPVAETSIDTTPDRNTYNYQQNPSLYNLNDESHQSLKLYEERLVANKKRTKAGEVSIGKHVTTETTNVAVPLDKERVVVERVTPVDANRVANASEANFREGEIAHMDIYEETPDIHKETVLREEVRVKKVVEHDTVEAQETIRREELDVDAHGLPVERRNA